MNAAGTVGLAIACAAAILRCCAFTQIGDGADSELIRIARSAVISEVTGATVMQPFTRQSASRGVFVTLERHGIVIGCRGTLLPKCPSIGEEVVESARSAAGHDPRYSPLTRRDLRDFLVTVTIVERLEPLRLNQVGELSPADGLVLTSGNRTGIVLPWEGKDPNVRLGWAYKKAGVSASSPCRLQRMIARRFRG